MAASRPVPVPASRTADPEHPGWGDVRRVIIETAGTVRAVVREMAGGPPGDDRLAQVAELCAAILDALAGPVGAIVFDEAIIAEREARAYEAGLADGAARCRSRPGYLRRVSGG